MATLTSAEETSTQVEACFLAAPQAEDLLGPDSAVRPAVQRVGPVVRAVWNQRLTQRQVQVHRTRKDRPDASAHARQAIDRRQPAAPLLRHPASVNQRTADPYNLTCPIV